MRITIRTASLLICCGWVSQLAAADIAAATRACVAAANTPSGILACERQAQGRWRARTNTLRELVERRLAGASLTDFKRAEKVWNTHRSQQFALLDRLAANAVDDLAKMTAEGQKTVYLQEHVKYLESLLSIIPAAPASRDGH